MKRLILTSGALIVLYTVLYFALMNRSPAYDPKNVAAEYPSSFKWSRPAIAGLGQLFPAIHWTNTLFVPLDLVFRRDDLKRDAEMMRWQEQNGRCYYDVTTQAAEQVVAPNRSLPPSQNSTPPVHGSED